MSDPLKSNSTPEEVLPYAPNWARHPGYRPSSQPGVSYDAFSDEENPSYRSMAEMFAPETERNSARKRNSHNGKMLLRFGAVVGLAGAALALFVGYIASQPERNAPQQAERFEGVSNAVAAIQAALTPSPAPAAAPVVAAAPAVEAPKPAPTVVPEPKAASSISSDRGAAPMPPPVDTNLVPEPQQPAAAAAAPQIAAIQPEAPPAPAPAPIVPELTAGELTTLMARGRRFIASGDFSSARPVYRRAAEAGYAEAALALGETYDPITLRERGVVGMFPDIKQARHWYERAKELGSLEAPTRLQRLPSE